MIDYSTNDLTKRYTVFEEMQADNETGMLNLVKLVNPFNKCKGPNVNLLYDVSSYGDYGLTTDAIVAGITAFKQYMGEMVTKLIALKDVHLQEIKDKDK